ncbi:MAG: AAA family ATPase [Candidatus Vecturithrix sp.]|jgi:cellulose biosynthesis protein BcsQ|nr:AAA family ATPase [Candidatus Vecturithrix sp.]
MKTLAFFNMKGGVGKTTAAVNLAYLASQEGHKTLLWDLDAQGAATFHFPITPTVQLNAKTFHKEKERLDRLIKPTDYTNLDLIPSNFKIRHLDVALGNLKKGTKLLSQFIRKLVPRYDYAFFDCPASLSLLAQSVFRASDLLVIPMIPTTLSVQTYEQMQRYLARHHQKKPQLIGFFSMVDQRKTLHREIIGQQTSEGVFCQAMIPTRSEIEKMGQHRAPLPAFNPDSQATQEFRMLWAEIKRRSDDMTLP